MFVFILNEYRNKVLGTKRDNLKSNWQSTGNWEKQVLIICSVMTFASIILLAGYYYYRINTFSYLSIGIAALSMLIMVVYVAIIDAKAKKTNILYMDNYYKKRILPFIDILKLEKANEIQPMNNEKNIHWLVEMCNIEIKKYQ